MGPVEFECERSHGCGVDFHSDEELGNLEDNLSLAETEKIGLFSD